MGVPNPEGFERKPTPPPTVDLGEGTSEEVTREEGGSEGDALEGEPSEDHAIDARISLKMMLAKGLPTKKVKLERTSERILAKRMHDLSTLLE
ncbi:MAG: hypothetical protein LQ340_005782 [Diploschistes diacapsis]|nr:MAG: hypothetical protein LQ340_005782 [Diploschistes diacapsis]